ncbi:MAG: hypothetical protein ABJB95_01490 [Gemmatimonadales bacterium]
MMLIVKPNRWLLENAASITPPIIKPIAATAGAPRNHSRHATNIRRGGHPASSFTFF